MVLDISSGGNGDSWLKQLVLSYLKMLVSVVDVFTRQRGYSNGVATQTQTTE